MSSIKKVNLEMLHNIITGKTIESSFYSEFEMGPNFPERIILDFSDKTRLTITVNEKTNNLQATFIQHTSSMGTEYFEPQED